MLDLSGLLQTRYYFNLMYGQPKKKENIILKSASDDFQGKTIFDSQGGLTNPESSVVSYGKYLNKKFIKTSREEIKEIFDINFFSNIYLLKSILKTKKLLIVNINSIAGINGSINESIYSASKHALKGFYESVELESKKNIQFLNIFLGAFKSKMTKNRQNYNKLMKPKDLADLISKNINEYESCSINKIFIKRREY